MNDDISQDRGQDTLIVALVGRPNVGKSTLFNRLTKSNKAIVDPTPGVTRDRHYGPVVWNERRIILVDTGGIELGTHDVISGQIQDQTWAAIEEADIILHVMDGVGGVLSEDYEVVRRLRRLEKPVYHLVNKVDGPEKELEILSQFYELGIDELWAISASHGFGMTTFFDFFFDSLPIPEERSEIPEEAIRIACIGRPNVGKSSLINKLLGQDRMLVSDIPGTTRDSVDSLLDRNGKQYLLIDTAGIRRKGKVFEKIEKFSVMRALASLERCDIALLLVDASEGITEQDTKVIGYALDRGRACLILVNKWDLVRGEKKKEKWIMDEVAMATKFMPYAPTIKISAVTGMSLTKILDTVDKVYQQYTATFSTNALNQVLKRATETHTPPLHNGRRLKLYYTTQVASSPPTFVLFVNYPKGIHFSYYRFLVNQFREDLGLINSPVKLLLRERKRKKYG
ncbi:MAG: ribosome biogenesis GTPase Der [Proteobacteria bacterium]|nr:ribosome biogenesis GTPase Der [Pseudomonadota bacterium]MBU1640315.1 ribosome biogenesis GTPase Der [Pseudomonadota bacterium]